MAVGSDAAWTPSVIRSSVDLVSVFSKSEICKSSIKHKTFSMGGSNNNYTVSPTLPNGVNGVRTKISLNIY